MRKYDYIDKPKELLISENSSLITKIYEYKRRQDLFIETDRDVLATLQEGEKIKSTVASNRIKATKSFRARDCSVSLSSSSNP